MTFKIGSGEGYQDFSVHKESACLKSPVLKAAFDGTFIEGQTQTYTLESTTPEAFRMFVKWLYSDRLGLQVHGSLENYNQLLNSNWFTEFPEETFQDPNQKEKHKDRCGRQDELLLELWILAEMLLMPRLQNYIVFVLLSIQRKCGTLGPTDYHSVYDNTTAESPIRRLIIDRCIYSREAYESAKSPHRFPSEMLFDLLTALGKTPRRQMMVDGRYLVDDGSTKADRVVGWDLPTNTSDIAKRVYALLLMERQDSEGLHVNQMVQKLGVPDLDILKAGDELLGAQKIHKTIDDETWAVLEY